MFSLTWVVETTECLLCFDAIVGSFAAASSDLTVWIGSCRRVLDHFWAATSKAIALSLTGALLECNWGGFKQFALPPLKKHALSLLGDPELSLTTLRNPVSCRRSQITQRYRRGAESRDWHHRGPTTFCPSFLSLRAKCVNKSFHHVFN